MNTFFLWRLHDTFFSMTTTKAHSALSYSRWDQLDVSDDDGIDGVANGYYVVSLTADQGSVTDTGTRGLHSTLIVCA